MKLPTFLEDLGRFFQLYSFEIAIFSQYVLVLRQYAIGFLDVFGLFPMCSCQVHKMFPSGCQSVLQVLQVFPKRFPISPFFFFNHILLFGHGSMCISCKRGAKGQKHASMLGRETYVGFLCWGVPNVQKIVVMGQSNISNLATSERGKQKSF